MEYIIQTIVECIAICFILVALVLYTKPFVQWLSEAMMTGWLTGIRKYKKETEENGEKEKDK